MTIKRRRNFTPDEIRAALADRDRHPDMQLKQWAKGYGIATSVYYRFARKMGNGGPAPARVAGKSKTKAPRTPRMLGATSTTQEQLTHALGQIRHWRGEATRLASLAISESLVG